jgi:crotonobetainyl-CoA:carnitine CoA-transferase CaiB-like acyl-CoA transferase
MNHPAGALDGLVVLDATQMLAGPLAATRLGDLGADVIKLEPPGSGEFNRTHGFEDLRVDGEMTTFLAVNRNKRSLALDLKRPEARDVLHRLVPGVDVVIQNFRPRTAARLGVDWPTLQAINPRLVHCSISGYGSQGPYRDRPGQDLVVQGYSGSMFSVGAKGEDPSPGALWAADVMTGYQAAIGVLAAIASRERTGVGQQVEVDMLSVVLDAQAQELVTYLNAGRQPQRTAERSAHGSIPAPYGVYRTADGWLTLAMCPLPALGEVLDDDVLRGYAHYNDGHRYRDEVYRRVRPRFVGRTTDEWIELCDQHGVWAGPVYDYEALERDPHVRATGAFVDQPQGDSVIRTTRVPIRMSATPPTIRRGAPRLGADTADVLRSVGFSADEVAGMAAAGVVGVLPGDGAPVDDRGVEVTA